MDEEAPNPYVNRQRKPGMTSGKWEDLPWEIFSLRDKEKKSAEAIVSRKLSGEGLNLQINEQLTYICEIHEDSSKISDSDEPIWRMGYWYRERRYTAKEQARLSRSGFQIVRASEH